MAQETYDVVVVGAGHNSLVAGAYCAKAGMKVGVLERNKWFGGGVVTHESTAPGFKHDHHATTHIFIRANPLIRDDELGLLSKFGLEYIQQPVSHASLFPDGSSIQTYPSLDKTCESIARHSQKDAVAYRRYVVEKVRPLMPVLRQGLFSPPLPLGNFMAMLEQSPEGRDLMGDLFRSAYEIIADLFESDKVRMHFMKWESESVMAPEEKGTGIVFYMMCGFAHDFPPAMPKGGSGELTASLIRCIEHHGGSVRSNSDVRRLLVQSGKAVGVELSDGSQIMAKRAVIGSIHPYDLDDFLGGLLPDRLKGLAKAVKPASYSAINTHYALKEAPKWIGGNEVAGAYAVETLPETLEEFRRTFDAYRYGELPKASTMVCIVATNLDPSRAPNGQATLYLYNFFPYELKDGGAESWAERKEKVADWMLEELRKYTTNMTDDNIIARCVDSPLEIAAASSSFRLGDLHGTALSLNQFGGRRPFPEIANYTVPGVMGFYLAGPFMHPGGGVTGGGRCTAMKMFEDFKIDFDAVVKR